MAKHGEILIGTSGYYYRDWVGSFYPEGTPTSRMLELYLEVFPALEVNSTYYGLATPSKMQKTARRLPQGYAVAVKTFKALTHGRKLDHAPACVQAMEPFRRRGIDPLFLAQFPQSFHCGPGNLDYVLRLVDTLRPFRVAVEFRHESWYDEKTFDALKDGNAVFVNVDAPALPGLPPPSAEATNRETAYVRLHGRNSAGWWGGNRYDYHYSQDELAEWLPRLDALRRSAGTVLVFFNNCHHASAARNALDLARMLGMRMNLPRNRRMSLFD